MNPAVPREPAPALEIEIYSSGEQHAAEWESLADRLAAPPFLHAGWILAWERAFAPRQVRLMCARSDGELVGVLPVLERRGVLASPTNWHTPQFGILAATEAIRGAMYARLLQRNRARVDLGFLDPVETRTAGEPAAREARQRTIVRTVLRSPHVSMTGSDWDSYRDGLTRRTRKETERLRRRFSELGSVQVEFVKETADLPTLLEEGFRLEGSGWKRKQGTAILSHPSTLEFYSQVARWAHQRGELLLAFLRVDGAGVAFDLCLEANHVTYVMKGGFDPAYRRYGPGMVLTYESLRRGFEQELVSYELLGADDPYKLAWTGTVRERVRFQAFARTPAGQIHRLAWSHGRRSARRAKQLVGQVRRAFEGRAPGQGGDR
jgi:CelD/BcsL family acetyltransferase involved in cellulose biosynthesis